VSSTSQQAIAKGRYKAEQADKERRQVRIATPSATATLHDAAPGLSDCQVQVTARIPSPLCRERRFISYWREQLANTNDIRSQHHKLDETANPIVKRRSASQPGATRHCPSPAHASHWVPSWPVLVVRSTAWCDHSTALSQLRISPDCAAFHLHTTTNVPHCCAPALCCTTCFHALNHEGEHADASATCVASGSSH
jgi:hypothetical protein